ncbi:MAG: alpha/beta hydrolase [Desulfamplus sp.]|nr:alpha/beta hydrolase [Desulfamplus sp.]
MTISAAVSPAVFKGLSPRLEEWLRHFHAGMEILKKRGFQPTPENTREGMFNLTRSLVLDKPEISLVIDAVASCDGCSVPVRIYHPEPDAALPVLLYYHGGGHMAGSVSIYDPICRKIALATRHIVVSVEYRLAPEFPYPAGVEDSYHVAKNIWSILDTAGCLKYSRVLCAAGDSAGGALCATVSHKAQFDKNINIARQVLIYPSLDYTMSLPSVDENGVGYLLEKAKIEWYFNHYFQNCQDRAGQQVERQNPAVIKSTEFETNKAEPCGKKEQTVYSRFKKASPLFMEITHNMPETLVITAQFCPLRDEGFAYVERLKKAGIHVEHLHFDNMIHAFLNMESLVPDECENVYKRIGDFLRV